MSELKMTNRCMHAAFSAMTLLWLSLASVSGAQPDGSVEDLGTIPGGQVSEALSVSSDGLVVVGRADTAAGLTRAFRWFAGGGMQNLNTLGGNFSESTGVSADGSVVVGTSDNSAGRSRAFRWSVGGGGMQDLGTLGGNSSEATGVSADGSIVFGTSELGAGVSHGFRWTIGGGMQDLAAIGASFSEVTGVSADGSVIVGNFQGHAYRWTAGGGMQDLGAMGGFLSVANGVSGDGSVVVGWLLSASGQTRAFRWTTDGGMADIGLLNGGSFAIAQSTSADGSVVVGYGDTGQGLTSAFRWTAGGGMEELGAQNGDFTPVIASGVSADGSVVAGTGSFALFQPPHAFRWICTNCGALDTDGDGLLDDWEINGVPYTDIAGVVQRYTLPDADPLHQDLYIEVDAMEGLSLSAGAIGMLVDAFANAPVEIDGVVDPLGIRLHIVTDEIDLPHLALWQTDMQTGWPLDFDNWRFNGYGTLAEREDPSEVALLAAKAMAYRYCIIADNAAPCQWGGSGQVHGDNFVLFIGNGFDDEHQAGIFMHELGHSLGLLHGGGDSINGKPNYPSVMNYALQFPSWWNKDFRVLDYSRADAATFPVLDELSLNEFLGVYSTSGLYNDYVMPYGVTYYNWWVGRFERTIKFVRLDGTSTDFGDREGTFCQDGRVIDSGIVQDLNYTKMDPNNTCFPGLPSLGEILRPFDDWGNIRLQLKSAAGPGAPAVGYPVGELTMDEQAWIDENFPPPPGSCLADLTRDGVLDFFDVQAFLNFYAGVDQRADLIADGILDFFDVQEFLNLYSAGCP